MCAAGPPGCAISMLRMWTARFRITRSSSSSIGFAYQSIAPRWSAVIAFSRRSLPVTMMTFVLG